jgi:hypothetical protein
MVASYEAMSRCWPQGPGESDEKPQIEETDSGPLSTIQDCCPLKRDLLGNMGATKCRVLRSQIKTNFLSYCLEWSENESTWHVGRILMMSVEQSVQ